MSQSFLDIIHRTLGDGGLAGDEHGGAGGSDGHGLPTSYAGNFLFATGIECSYPTIEHGRVRRDLLAECGHCDRWREDLGLVRELGLRVLRCGLPYYTIHLGPGRYNWKFADLVMAEMQRLESTAYFFSGSPKYGGRGEVYAPPGRAAGAGGRAARAATASA